MKDIKNRNLFQGIVDMNKRKQERNHPRPRPINGAKKDKRIAAKKKCKTNPISDFTNALLKRSYEKYAPNGTPGNEPNQTRFKPDSNPLSRPYNPLPARSFCCMIAAMRM
jgi:hypothetical protein